MDTTLDLNQLVMEAPASGAPQRGEVVLNVDRKSTGPEGVSLAGLEKPSVFHRMMGRREIERRILVRCGRSVAMEPLSFKSEDVATEVIFAVSLKLDLATPEASKTDSLRQLAFAFRDATLEAPGSIEAGSPASTPSGRFAREMTQWLRNTYRSGDKLKQYSEPGWLEDQNRWISKWIREQYGLDAIVKLKVEVESEQRLGPVAVTVETTACDSDIPVKFTINIGCELIKGGVFGAPSLTKSDLERRTREQADLFVRQKVTLQQFRFTETWRQDLKSHLNQDLKPFNRKISEFTIPLPVNATYSRGPHAIRAGDAVFEPAGWNSEDKITFSGDAQIVIENAAVFEKGRSHNDLLNVKARLTEWLRSALQEAISEELHLVHDQRVGYADLLANWSEEDSAAGSTGTYKARIESNLARRAQAAGLNASTIIATPNRAEMDLLSGAEISLSGLALPSKDPGATLNFDATATIKIASFKDIRDLLNRTHNPLQVIEKEIVEKTLRREAQKISYLQFYQFFESGPGPGGSEGSDTGCVGWLEDRLRAALTINKLQLVGFAAKQTSTEHYEVFKRLQETAPQLVDVELAPAAVHDGTKHVGTTAAYKVQFLLDITGLDGTEIHAFLLKNWRDFSGQNTEYGAVLEYVRAYLPKAFVTEDRIAFGQWEKPSDENREFTEALVNQRLNEFLAKNLGLSGRANSVAVANATSGVVLVQQTLAGTQLALDRVILQRETKGKIDSINSASQVDMTQSRADNAKKWAGHDDIVSLEEHLVQIEQDFPELPDVTKDIQVNIGYKAQAPSIASQKIEGESENPVPKEESGEDTPNF